MLREKRYRWLLWLVVMGVAGVVLVMVVRRAQRPPDEPQPIAWDQEPCAHCHMLIGERGFAAQLATEEGRVLDFDDPGCLLRYVAEMHPHVHAVYFHHASQDRWLTGDEVAFRRVATSPMGWGLAAVGRDEPHDLDRAGAAAEIAAAHEPEPLAGVGGRP